LLKPPDLLAAEQGPAAGVDLHGGVHDDQCGQPDLTAPRDGDGRRRGRRTGPGQDLHLVEQRAGERMAVALPRPARVGLAYQARTIDGQAEAR
jgi:hypothetical protein